MTETLTIKTKIRNFIGTGSARNLRLKGFIPAVLYGANSKTTHLLIDKQIIKKKFIQEDFVSNIINIEFGSNIEKALIREIQFDPITDFPIHIDFLRVTEKSFVSLSIPLQFINKNDSPGLKRGAVLNIIQHEIYLTCPTNLIPKKIIIDLKNLDIGDSINVDSLILPSGSKFNKRNINNILATIVAPSILKSKDQENEAKTSEEKDV